MSAAGGASAAAAAAAAAEEPHATTKHTICGYAWSDVINALQRAIAGADMTRALRWSAELVCSEQGLGRLEATLLHAWALHVGPALPTWPRGWYTSIQQIRVLWERSHGDTKAMRNTPLVRQLVAEATAQLVLAAKKPLPSLPTSADCFREAEAMRARVRAGGGAGDQAATRRVWTPGHDGLDLKTIGNEFEAALRAGQTARLLFWVIWILTLDKQIEAPPVKERGPAHLSTKARKSIVWFLVAVLREIANEGAYLSVEERNGLFECFSLTWGKLGEKGRRDMLAALALSIEEHMQRRGTPTLTGPTAPPPYDAVRAATYSVDEIYSGIAIEARRYLLEVPKIAGLTAEAERAKDAAKAPGRAKLSSVDKLALVFALGSGGGSH
jgi:hypothetical protein